MAEGTTNRFRLNVDTASTDTTKRSLETWSRRLPFADVGFEFYRSTTQVLAAATDTLQTFDTTILNKEGFAFTGANLIIPPGKSGVYLLEYMAYVTAYTVGASILVIIFNNTTGIALAQQPMPAGLDRMSVYGLARLREGDSISAGVFNNMAAGTLGTYPGGARTPVMPHFKGVRVALLD